MDSSTNVMTVMGIIGKESVEIGEYKVSTARANIKKPLGDRGITAIALSPSWYPDSDTIRYFKLKKGISLPSVIPPGHPQNYMGAAKISLTHTVDGKNLYRIHGTLNEKTIGTKESAGCVRMKNKEVTELAKLLSEFSKIKGMGNIRVALK